jgi:hypothetical protein
VRNSTLDGRFGAFYPYSPRTAPGPGAAGGRYRLHPVVTTLRRHKDRSVPAPRMLGKAAILPLATYKGDVTPVWTSHPQPS